MRNIDAKLIEDTVARLCIEANLCLPDDVTAAIERAEKEEPWYGAKKILSLLGDNVRIASEKMLPVCQDTGMACVFLELGQDVHIDGNIEEAVNNGVRRGYGDGYLRKSVVCDPLRRVNTGDNTPALLSVKLVPGESLRITVMPKGFGSENMSRIKMFNPTAQVEEIVEFVYDTVYQAGGNPCPPLVIGVGLGGSFDYAAVLAKKALAREVGVHNERYRELEERILRRVNESGVGPSGLGGDTTALWAAVEAYPTHIAGLPVAVNISCHATRHAEKII